MMKQIDEILQRVEQGKATDEELKMADQYLGEMEQRLSSQIDEWACQEHKSDRQHPRVWLRHVIAAAACLLLLASVTVWYNNRQEKKDAVAVATEKDTFDNPEEAAAETERALLVFSGAINKAIDYNQSY